MIFSEDIFFTTNAAGEEVYDYEHTIKHWPPPSKRDRPKWVDRLSVVDGDLYRLLTDVYSALEIDLHVLSAIGVRTTFDRGAELLGIDPSLTFAGKLSALASQGFIGSTEKDALGIVTDAGSASAHRGWRPTPEQLDTMLQIIEAFVHRNFVLRTDLSALTNAIPVRHGRSSTTATTT